MLYLDISLQQYEVHLLILALCYLFRPNPS